MWFIEPIKEWLLFWVIVIAAVFAWLAWVYFTDKWEGEEDEEGDS